MFCESVGAKGVKKMYIKYMKSLFLFALLLVACDTSSKPDVKKAERDGAYFKLDGEIIEDIEDLKEIIEFKTHYAEKTENSKQTQQRSQMPPEIVIWPNEIQ